MYNYIYNYVYNYIYNYIYIYIYIYSFVNTNIVFTLQSHREKKQLRICKWKVSTVYGDLYLIIQFD